MEKFNQDQHMTAKVDRKLTTSIDHSTDRPKTDKQTKNRKKNFNSKIKERRDGRPGTDKLKNIFTTRQVKHIFLLNTEYDFHPEEIATQYDVPVHYIYDTLSIVEDQG